MKIYPDANIFMTLLLGEKQEDLAERFFKKSADCRFDLVVSKTTFAEINQRLKSDNTLWMQAFIDDFRKAGKLEIVEITEKDTEKAIQLNQETGGQFGLNDYLHALLAQRHADSFVTNDLKFRKTAANIVKTETLEDFLARL